MKKVAQLVTSIKYGNVVELFDAIKRLEENKEDYETKAISEAIIYRLDDKNRRIRERLSGYLIDSASENYMASLEHLVDDSSPFVRSNACIGLARMGKMSVYPLLKKCLYDRNELVRSDAIEGFLNNPLFLSLDEMLVLLNDKSKYVRMSCGYLLEERMSVKKKEKRTILDRIQERLRIERVGMVRSNLLSILYIRDNQNTALTDILNLLNSKRIPTRMRTYINLLDLINSNNYKVIESTIIRKYEIETNNYNKQLMTEILQKIKVEFEN